MVDKSHFFNLKNTVRSISDSEIAQTKEYLEVIDAFARTTYQSIYVIDYQKQGFEYVSENPLFLCGHSPAEVTAMGYDFYFKYVPKEDLELLVKVNTVGFDFYETIPLEDRKQYTIAYDFHLQTPEGKRILIHQKLTPLFLTEEGKIWKAICIISLSSQQQAGNIKVYKQGDDTILEYNLNDNYWANIPKVQLTEREKEVLQFSIRGYTMNEIASQMFISLDTVKFHRRKIFEKLNVASMTEAISYSTMNKLI